MSALRNLFDDLVEKKLWPIALALVVALVALPLAFGAGGGADEALESAPAAGGPIAATAAAGGAVALEGDAAVDKRLRKGKVRDPFRQLARAKKASTSSGSTSVATAPSSSGSSSSSVAKRTGGSAPRPGIGDGGPEAPQTGPVVTSTGPVAVKPRPTPVVPKADGPAEVVLRFGLRGAEQVRTEDPTKLQGFPSSKFPLLVFSQVRKDGRALRFMVNPLAKIAGEGTCRPSRETCRMLEVGAGQTTFVSMLKDAETMEHYRLDVVCVSR